MENKYEKNILETIIGGIVIVISLFFLIFAYNTSGLNSSSTGIRYQAKFDRVDGLIVGSDVRMSGVKIGAIQSIKIDPKTFQAIIHFKIDPEIKLPKDSSAEIVSDGIMGGKYFALVPGGDDIVLKEDDFVAYTQSSVSLESMIGQLIFNAKEDKNIKQNPK